MEPEIVINGRKVGKNHKPLIIAEIGINHNGSLDLAKKLVDEASQAGAEIIKHQTHIIDDEMSEEAKNVVPNHTTESIYEIMKNSALSEEDEKELMEYTIKKSVIFISTPFSRAAADRLEKFDIPAYKIGSGECNNYPFIEHVASFGKPMIISTGMNSIESISPTVNILRKNKIQYALLHCTNIYPTPHKLVRLGAIEKLQSAFPDAVVGLSDHTTSINTCLGAVALGASILERHFTDSMDREGPDISSSMDGKNLTNLINGSNEIFLARGSDKNPLSEEQGTISFAFASVVSIRDINQGETLTKDNIWLKRPGSGDFGVNDYYKLIGKKAKINIKKNRQIKKTDFIN